MAYELAALSRARTLYVGLENELNDVVAMAHGVMTETKNKGPDRKARKE
ncbi:MAG: hypothetical protein OXF88_12220 [Rhodobacteraceae bacterium]|nr:hypothetical protein [Paracoccaceae bacterium]MCY4137890.1 hypothetical protein [Paracoccaceae bacterium]